MTIDREKLIARLREIRTSLDDGRLPTPYDLFRAVRSEGEGTGWRYEAVNLGIGTLDTILAALESRPAPTEERRPIMLEIAAADERHQTWERRWQLLMSLAYHNTRFREGDDEWRLSDFLAYAGECCGFATDTTPSRVDTEDQRFQAAITASNSFNNWPARDFRLNPLQETEREYWRPIAAALATPSRDEEGSVDREAIARIIDPKAGECADNIANGLEMFVDRKGHRYDYWKNAWAMWAKSDWSNALSKAEAILALKTSTPETQTVEGGGQ